MKHLKLAMICLGFVFTITAVTEAEAGKIKKPPKGSRTEKTQEEMKSVRIDKHPPMAFMGGTLTQDIHVGWKIGNMALVLAKDCKISFDGESEGVLMEGSEAVIMGTRVGNTISARSIVISRPGYRDAGNSSLQDLRQPGPNPNAGYFTSRPD